VVDTPFLTESCTWLGTTTKPDYGVMLTSKIISKLPFQHSD
jgi:hypothetical protein